MLFQFTPAIQAAIDAGRYVQIFTSAGVPIGMVRDPLTGKFVAHAIGAVVKNSSLSPLVAASQLVIPISCEAAPNVKGLKTLCNKENDSWLERSFIEKWYYGLGTDGSNPYRISRNLHKS